MTEENGQHEFNFFLDKQIQQRLLEADEELLAKQSLSSQVPSNCRQKASSVIGSIGGQGNSNQINANKNNSSNFQKALNKELQTIPLCGWCAEATVTYRKTENDGSSKSKGNTGISSREALLSRDSRNRPQASQEFMFRHYTDPRRYIEQYRREHVCYDTANSSATKNEFLDTRRFYAYNQYSPLAVCTQNSTFQQSSTLPPPLQESTFVQSSEQQQQSQSRQPQTPTIQYTNRRDQQRQTIHATLRSNNQHKYKFSNAMPSKSDSNQVYDKVSEFSESSDHSRRAGSAKESPSTPTINGVSVQKALAAKVNVPSSNSGVMSARNLKPPRPGSPQEPNITNQFMSQKLGQGSGGPSRTLDTLACVAGSAGEKQSSGVPEAVDSSTQARLESLRRVNKRAAKPQPAQLHLTFIREEESLRHPSHPPPTHQLDCKEVSRMLQPQQTPQSSDLPSSSIILTTTNNNANDPNNSVSSSNDGSDKDGRTVGDATKKPRKTRSKVSEETFSSWKERSLLAMKELEGSQLRDCGSDRRSLAKKFEERTLISHRRRIKHLIEQSRLKSKFGQFLGQAKGPSKKTTLKLSNIQIGDPYVIAASGRDGDNNDSNSGREESHEMDKLHYAWSSTRKHGSETQSESRHPDTGPVLTVSDTISKFHTTLYNSDDSDQMLKNDFSAPHDPSSAEDKNSGAPRQDELMGHDFFSHFRGNLDDRAHVPVAYGEPRGDNQWNKENDNDSYLPGEDNLFLTSVHKRYIDKLAEQVSATVKFRVPKFKYSNVTDMNRSQTMNL